MTQLAPAGPLTVLHAPCHGPSMTMQTVRFALSGHIGADSVAFSEAYRMRDSLEAGRPRWRVTMPLELPGDDWDSIRGKFDCPVLVRRRHPLVDEWTLKVARRSFPRKIAPDRWANAQTYAHELGPVEHSAMHPHAVVQGLHDSIPRVQEYARSMRRLEAHLERSLEAGKLPVVTGDLNHPDVDGPSWVPRRTFARLGLKTWAVGIDWVAWHPALVIVDRKVISREQTRMDHPWLVTRFEGFR